MQKINRRNFLTTAGAASLAAGCVGAWAKGADLGRKARTTPGPSLAALDAASAAPVLKRELFPSPVIIDSFRFLKRNNEYLVHIRSKDGAEGVSFVNPPRGPGMTYMFNHSVGPFFIGTDARNLEETLWKLYRRSYKEYGLLFWSMQAWMEFAILDMLGRIAQKPIGALVGDIVRTEIPF